MADRNAHVKIIGSDRTPLPGAVRGAPIASDATVRVSVLVRRRQAPAENVTAASGVVRTHLSRDEFRDRYGADPADLDRVSSVLAGYGMQTVESNAARRTIVVVGTATGAAAAFNVELARYTAGAKTYRGHEGPVHVPAEIDGLVEGVFGLDDRQQATPHFVRGADLSGHVISPRASQVLTALDAVQAYKFPPFSGSGQTIAIIELGGGFLASDNTSYFSSLNLATPTILAVSVDMAANSPGLDLDADDEVGLDIQVAGGCAPGATIVVYFAPNSDAGFIDAVTTAVNDSTNNPSVISISWGSHEEGWTTASRNAMESALADAATMGVTVCLASGDAGASDLAAPDGLAHVDFPASAPHALACGGTRLDLVKGAPVEAVWNQGSGVATGGGISSLFGEPSYQLAVSLQSPVNPGAGTGRGVPDVAGSADPATAYKVHIHGKDVSIGGTSAVAPMWAAPIARLNQAIGGHLGFINPTLYRLLRSGVFTDITSGNNDVGKDNGGYTARAGWDCCTGLGTPLGTSLLAALTSSKLSQFFSPNQITCGYSDSSPVFIDKVDTVPVDIQLTNDNPALVTVPVTVTIPVGSTSVAVNYLTVARSGPFLPEFAKVHAEYAGVKLTASIEIVPPRVVSLTLSPSVVTSGGSSTATVTLDRPSLNGEVVLDLLCGAPGFATLPVPPQLKVSQGQGSGTFTITTPPSALAFPTAHATIMAIYRTGPSDPGTSASATLSVQSQVVAGILNTLTLFPTTVTAGAQSGGTVTLVQAVPVATVVGLAALEPLSGGGRLPLAGNASTIASVPPSITIAAGQTSGHFTLTTSVNITPGTKRNVTIMAGAVQTQTATLVVTA